MWSSWGQDGNRAAADNPSRPKAIYHPLAVTKVLVNIDVDDLERAVRFYTSAFGLTVGQRLGEEVVELVGGGTPLYLLRKGAGTPPFSGATASRSYERHWTPVHLDFGVRHLEPAVAAAEAAGARREGPIEEHDWGRIAYFSDPFGHGFCLVTYRRGEP
jgi:lactoylglutathione lyase